MAGEYRYSCDARDYRDDDDDDDVNEVAEFEMLS